MATSTRFQLFSLVSLQLFSLFASPATKVKVTYAQPHNEDLNIASLKSIEGS